MPSLWETGDRGTWPQSVASRTRYAIIAREEAISLKSAGVKPSPNKLPGPGVGASRVDCAAILRTHNTALNSLTTAMKTMCNCYYPRNGTTCSGIADTFVKVWGYALQARNYLTLGVHELLSVRYSWAKYIASLPVQHCVSHYC